MGCIEKLSFLRHFFFGIVLGTFNLGSSLVNIHYLLEESHNTFAYISVFLLWFPGLVTSISFLVLYVRGNEFILRLLWWKCVLYPVLLLVLAPVIPILLTLAFLITQNRTNLDRAVISKYFTAFLDHGPHFVLRLVIVVLVGISQRGVYTRHDAVFVMSMVTSFLSMIYTALWFNERVSTWLQWLFLAGPMYSAIFAGRAFTLAVLMKTSLQDNELQVGSFVLLLVIMYITNLGLFRLCGQDWTRSAVFGVASLLLPAGYNNDLEYYQVPGQDILVSTQQYTLQLQVRLHDKDVPEAQDDLVETPSEGKETVDDEEVQEEKQTLVPMQSTKFLLLHVVVNTGLMFVTSAYVFFSQNLDTDSDDALVIPQLLGVIPGLLFAAGYCVLMVTRPENRGRQDSKITKVCGALARGGAVIVSVIFAILGWLSLVPALFWTFMYKWFTSVDVKISLLDNLTKTTKSS